MPQVGLNPQEDYFMGARNMQDRRYYPSQEWIGQNQNLPLQLLTADEKISELT